MEAQILLLGVSSTCTLSPKTCISQSLTTSYSPFSSVKIRATKSIAFKTRFCVHSCTPSTNPRLESTVCIDKLQREIVEDSPDELYRKVRRKKLAVFVSGGGSNFKSLHKGSVNGLVHGDISVLVTSKPDCGGAEFARNKGIPVILFPKAKDGTGLSSKDLVSTLKAYEIDFILLAGYLKRVPLELIKGCPRSKLNIHPSLLPAFGGKGYYGMKVHQAVVASGARYSGATIHFVDEEYDTGRILARRIVPVNANDTAEDLAAQVLHEEHKLYVEVANALCEERIFWREDGVPIIRSKENPDHYV